jgi:uncharacterized caspase-like protein
LDDRDVAISIYAWSGDRRSDPARILFKYVGVAAENPRASPELRPRLVALLVGVNDYSKWPPLMVDDKRLRWAVRDAEELKKALEKQKQRAFSEVNVTVLPNATRGDIIHALQRLFQENQKRSQNADRGEVTLFYFSGHGLTAANQFHLLPSDAEKDNMSNWTSFTDILSRLGQFGGSKVIVIDACRSDTVIGSIANRLLTITNLDKVSNDVADQAPNSILFSGSGGEPVQRPDARSYESDRLKHGIFTSALIRGISGAAKKNGNGEIDTDYLYIWLKEEVPRLAKEEKKEQTPRWFNATGYPMVISIPD